MQILEKKLEKQRLDVDRKVEAILNDSSVPGDINIGRLNERILTSLSENNITLHDLFLRMVDQERRNNETEPPPTTTTSISEEMVGHLSFARVIQELLNESYEVTLTSDLFDKLCVPVSGRLTRAALYRNAETDVLSADRFCLMRRLIECYGNPPVESLLNDMEGLTLKSYVEVDEFQDLCGLVGIGPIDAKRIWTQQLNIIE